jgi:hypothetical protein
MNDDGARDKSTPGSLELRVRRFRTHLATRVRTGSAAGSWCATRTDPTGNGLMCPTVQPCGITSHVISPANSCG